MSSIQSIYNVYTYILAIGRRIRIYLTIYSVTPIDNKRQINEVLVGIRCFNGNIYVYTHVNQLVNVSIYVYITVKTAYTDENFVNLSFVVDWCYRINR